MKTRRQFSPDFKAKAALEAIKGHRTTNEIASEFEVHPIQLGTWKRAAIGAPPGHPDSPGRAAGRYVKPSFYEVSDNLR